jgi:hypothetical protein
MRRLILNRFSVLAALVLFAFVLTNCSEDEPFATISINETGSDVGGDVTGDGGSAVRSYTWNNALQTVDWNMDITASKEGSFNLKIDDADGKNVLNQTLVVGQGDDSKSGVSALGTAGAWTITVTMTDFNGDGSFSISPGN